MSPPERYTQLLRENGTLGDGETVCCSVGEVAPMLDGCYAMGRVEGAFEAVQRLREHLSAEGVGAAQALLEELMATAKNHMRKVGN